MTAATMPINSSGITYAFAATDVITLGAPSYGYILRDVTHDIGGGTTEIWAGGLNDWVSCVGVHAAAGITYNLAELRKVYGDLTSVSCFAGVDQCGSALLNLYVIFSDDGGIIGDALTVLGAAANGGAPIDAVIPENAAYLTLAVGAADSGKGCDHGVFADAQIRFEGEPPPPTDEFIRGDPDDSGALNITDGIYVLNFLFLGGPPPWCPDAADADNSGSINITDGIYVLNFLFLGGPPPPPPHPDCGVDQDDGEEFPVDSLGPCREDRPTSKCNP
jgi:hypothetical protein